MKIINAIGRAVAWVLCLGLRCTAWTSNRLQTWISSGPSPRLWAASDEELVCELRKRGVKLSVKGGFIKKQKQAPTQQAQPKTTTVNVTDYTDIELAVANLQDVSKQRAREAVIKAKREIALSGECASDNVVLAKAVKYT